MTQKTYKPKKGQSILGLLACLDGYVNIAMEQTEEYANGQLKNKGMPSYEETMYSTLAHRRGPWLRGLSTRLAGLHAFFIMLHLPAVCQEFQAGLDQCFQIQ
nr:sm-like protein LSM36B isoform X2 [Ipomoea trifida]